MDKDTPLAQSLDTLIEDALADVLDALAARPDSSRTRELRAKARSYDQAIKRWSISPPSDAQRQALRELVAELHAKVRS